MNRRSLVLVLALVALLLGIAPVAAAPQAANDKWWGDYYDNRTLSGSPVMSRYDDAINFSWGGGSPDSAVPVESFSVRWVRDAWFTGGTHRFKVLSDDGVRIWVGDLLVVDQWFDRHATTLIVDRYIPEGTHQVRVEYFEHHGDATISIGWSRLASAAWYGEYFDNKDLNDWPVLMRNDVAIDFEWGNGSPDPAVPADGFSVRWTRTLSFDAGTYRFRTSTDDGVRVYVDGSRVVDSWEDQKQLNTHEGDLYLSSGQHTIVVEYYEHGGEASAHVWWFPLDSYATWHGEYFTNLDFVGGPAMVRGDAEIDFDWGTEPPAEWMPDDNFSVRWTRTINFTPGYYRFVVQADDGVRLWLDNSIIIDKWQDMDYELHYVDGIYLQGQHALKLEFYERNGNARVRFWWEAGTNNNAPPTSLPAAAAPATQVEDDPWETSYFANTDLSGRPVLTRIETSLDHYWGFGSPGDAVPKDYFSARWTQPLTFGAGIYRFTTYTDDGVRLWVDGRLVIDSWRPMRGYRSVTLWLNDGVHDVRMEYYERSGIALARLTWQWVERY